MGLNIVLIVLFSTYIAGVKVGSDDGDVCDVLLEKFTNEIANFTRCFVKYARPVRVCTTCYLEYSDLLVGFDNINNAKETTQCQKKLMDLDPLKIVIQSFEFAKQLWDRELCGKCISGGNGHLVKRRLTSQLLNNHGLLENCISKNLNTTICTKCVQYYNATNKLYEDHKINKGFCADIIDMMNSTRYEWSKTHGCCDNRKLTDYLLFISTGSVLLLPVIFYSTIWLLAQSTRTNFIRIRWLSNLFNHSVLVEEERPVIAEVHPEINS